MLQSLHWLLAAGEMIENQGRFSIRPPVPEFATNKNSQDAARSPLAFYKI
jgi:hypothetical protein